MDNEMIERCAKAMCENRKYVWTNCDKAYWRGAAKACIKAMREPTEKMIAAGMDGSSLKLGSSAYGCWQEMIDIVIGDA